MTTCAVRIGIAPTTKSAPSVVAAMKYAKGYMMSRSQPPTISTSVTSGSKSTIGATLSDDDLRRGRELVDGVSCTSAQWERHPWNSPAEIAAFIAFWSPDRVVALLDEVERLRRYVTQFIEAAKAAIPQGEHPLEDTVENWAWQIRNLGEDRRASYREVERLRDDRSKWQHTLDDDNG